MSTGEKMIEESTASPSRSPFGVRLKKVLFSSCLAPPSNSPSLEYDDHFWEISSETSYEKACSDRRGSAPATPVLGLRNMDTTTTSRFANFFSKRSFKSNPLKRTKSVTKLERKRCTIDGDSVPPSRLRTSRSHESLLQSSPSALATLDLSHGDVQVSALHSSLLGQENCFQMVSNGGTRFYTCRTKEERDRWLYSLKKTIQPNQDNVRRKENFLRIWILEAKGIVAKKSKYYCELCLDKTLYARTSSKQKGDMCFWGEHFEFGGLPNVESIYVNLYREADKKKRRDKNVLIGTVHIPVSTVSGRHLLEKWYPVVSEKNPTGKDIPSIRIKSRFQSVEILPLVVYKELWMHLKANYKVMCEMLEPVISVRAKEDVATILVNIMQKENMAKEFLADVVMSDIEKVGDLHLTFRGNSLATKATEAYMKLLGDKYLQETLGIFLRMALDAAEDCEVDPMKVANNGTLHRQQANLMTYVEMVWVKIINSANNFPSELQEVFHEYRKRLTSLGKDELCDNLISASIFLRFLCPAILSPSLFNLSQEYPQGRAARNLTLVAKTIQTLANFTRFGGKESFMEFMNGFVEKEWSTMKSFLKQISSPPSKDFPRRTDFDGYIDIGKELAILHNLLVENLCKVNQKSYFNQVDQLQTIMDSITAALAQSSQKFYKSPILSNSMKPDCKVSSSNMNINNNNMEANVLDNGNSFHDVKTELMCSYIKKDEKNDNEYCSFSLNPQKCLEPITAANRPSTLPRNAYLMGSAKMPATDLSTSDDYVLYSALNEDLCTAHHNEIDNNSKNNLTLLKKENSISNRLTQSSIYSEVLNSKTNNNQADNFIDYGNSSKKISNEKNIIAESGNCSKNGMITKNISGSCKVLNFTDEIKEINKKTNMTETQDEDFANSSGEMEISNTKGSQISIGQLSTVASSGYQSFPYSQSNSPVDLTYQQENNVLKSSAPHPLAFNNPMYHFSTDTMLRNRDPGSKTHHKHIRLSQLSTFSSLSAEDISFLCHTSFGAVDPSPLLSTNGCCCSSSSSGSASCNSTPPAERRSMHFKSTAPRTNPHFSGSLLISRNVCATCSPRLSSRALSHPVRNYRVNQDGCPCAATLLYRKSHNSNRFSRQHFQPKLNLNFTGNNALDKNSNFKSSSSETASNVKLDSDENSLSVNKGKTLADYEHEVEDLRKQMLNLQVKLSDAENKLFKQEANTERVVADWQARLEAGEERIRKQQEEKDQQMKNIITRSWRKDEFQRSGCVKFSKVLITVEEELRREQQEMQGVINTKQKIIDTQERKIQTLDTANSRLLGALAQLKERYQIQGRNGTSISSPNSPAKLAVLESTDVRFKSSSC